MKIFKFKFEKALEYKEQYEKIARGEFVKVKNEKQEQEQELILLKRKKKNFLKNSIGNKKGKLDLILLQQTNRQLENYKNKMKQINENIKDKEIEIEKKKEKLLEAVQDYKIFKKLKEKGYEKYTEEQKKTEQNFLDEITNNNYSRGKKNGR